MVHCDEYIHIYILPSATVVTFKYISSSLLTRHYFSITASNSWSVELVWNCELESGLTCLCDVNVRSGFGQRTLMPRFHACDHTKSNRRSHQKIYCLSLCLIHSTCITVFSVKYLHLWTVVFPPRSKWRKLLKNFYWRNALQKRRNWRKSKTWSKHALIHINRSHCYHFSFVFLKYFWDMCFNFSTW